jgi:tripartite-type tricarboxylate transporter receptor subunit TctC
MELVISGLADCWKDTSSVTPARNAPSGRSVNTLDDVIAYAKTNPRWLVFAAGGGTGSPAHL